MTEEVKEVAELTQEGEEELTNGFDPEHDDVKKEK